MDQWLVDRLKRKKEKKKLLKSNGKGKQTNRSGTICSCKGKS